MAIKETPPQEAEQCPGCDVRLPPGSDQIKHMQQNHPEIIAERLAEAARWDGWEDDD